MTDPIRAALERLIARLDETADPDGPVPAWVDSYCAARAALAEQQGKGPSDIPPGPFSEHELREQWNQQADEFNQWDSLDSCEQLAWAQARAIQRDRNARPTPPAEGEVAELAANLRMLAPHNPLGTADPTITRAAELLEQRHPAPVPVAERLPGCDAEGTGGWCWWWRTDGADEWWELLCISDAREYNAGCGNARYTHWLPAHALPLPAFWDGDCDKTSTSDEQ